LRNKFQVVIAGSNGYTNKLYLLGQASSEIKQSTNTAQPYCSSILGYTTPIVTATATVVTTSTPLGTQTTADTETAITTTTQIDVTTTTTSTAVTSTATSTTTLLETTIVSTTIVESPQTTIVTSTYTAPQAGAFSKRSISLPTVLSKYPASIVTSACALAVPSPIKTTTTVTSVRTSTLSTLYSTQTTFTTTATTTTATSSTITTQTYTDIIPESTTLTMTSTFNAISTSTTASLVTVTTVTTTTAAPACTATNYVFKVVSGDSTGRYLSAYNPGGFSPYNILYAVDGLAQARQWTIQDNGVVSSRTFNGNSIYNLVARDPYMYYGPATLDPSGYPLLYCSVVASSEPAVVSAGAAGVLTCHRADNVDLLLAKCTYGFGAVTSLGACTPVTIAAVFVGPGC
jgi:hypothetical protein